MSMASVSEIWALLEKAPTLISSTPTLSLPRNAGEGMNYFRAPTISFPRNAGEGIFSSSRACDAAPLNFSYSLLRKAGEG